ncbi:MAG: hypothetical protein WD048_00325 [Chitinophagales bacterium]
MQQLLIFFLGFFIGNLALAQDVAFSEPEKISSKTPNFQILGKNNDGVILYKYGKGDYEINAFNSNLKNIWSKKIRIPEDEADIKRFVIFPDSTWMFFSSIDQNGIGQIKSMLLSSKFEYSSQPILLDTLSHNKYLIEDRLKIVHSKDRSHLVAYLPFYEGNNMDALYLLGIQGKDSVYTRSYFQNNLPGDYILRKVEPDSKGNVFILLEHEKKGDNRKPMSQPEYLLWKYDRVTDLFIQIRVDFERPFFDKLMMDIDNHNESIVLSGLYADAEGKLSEGYYLGIYDIKLDALTVNRYEPYNREIFAKVTGKEDEKMQGFYSFKISDIVLRYDGGVNILIESSFDNTESMEIPSFTPSAGPNYRTVNVIYYNDVIVLSTKADGSLDWYSVVKKKQVSEDDEGFFSSYCLLTRHNHLRLIYNEEIYHKTNINAYRIDKKGGQQRKFVLNAADNNIFLVPSLGKQISATEVLIPSFKRNYFRLVKFNFN